MFDLRQIETFLQVIATGSFHAAGRKLGLAQPTVSQHIRKLEEYMRVTLVARSSVGCRPTDAARIFLPYAESLMQLNCRALNAVTRTRIVVGASGNIGTYILPDIIRRFEASRSGVPIDLVIAPNPVIAAQLEHAEIDVALLEWWDARAGFEAKVWREEPLVAIVARDHAWAGRSAISTDELRDAPILGGEPGSGTGRLLRERLNATAPAVRQLASTEAVKRAVRAGLGLSIVLKASVADEVTAGHLVALDITAQQPLTKSFWAAHRLHLPATAADRRFVEFLGKT
jgi:LysR family transcriptional regulator, low CO2-responsive transcriptional regulator